MANETGFAPELHAPPAAARSGSQGAPEKTKPHAESAVFEDHRILSQAQAEPLPRGCVGVRVRVRLSGCPSRRWSRALGGRLVNELVGHGGVGHLRINDIVQGDQIVLEGVEARDARAIAAALGRAIDATNHVCIDGQKTIANVAQQEADAIAAQVALECGPSRKCGPQPTPAQIVTPTHWFG